MLRRSLLHAILLTFAGVSTVHAQEFWEKKKDYREWTEKDVKKMLEDSPWARQQVFTGQFQASGRQGISQQDSGREYHPQITYRLQLRSALPLRKALVRKMMFDARYDNMPAEQKQAFDNRAEQFLAADFSDRVIIHVAFSSNVQVDDRELNRYWQGPPPDALKTSVYLLLPNGERIQPTNFVPNQTATSGQFQFVFSRSHNGELWLHPADKQFSVTFPHPQLHGESDTRVFVEFKVQKMLVDGQVMF